jgi:hypothetical protein
VPVKVIVPVVVLMRIQPAPPPPAPGLSLALVLTQEADTPGGGPRREAAIQAGPRPRGPRSGNGCRLRAGKDCKAGKTGRARRDQSLRQAASSLSTLSAASSPLVNASASLLFRVRRMSGDSL